MTTKPLTKEQAIATWTELQRLISVGAYEERGALHYETDTWPEDGVEESTANLERWAERQGPGFATTMTARPGAWSRLNNRRRSVNMAALLARAAIGDGLVAEIYEDGVLWISKTTGEQQEIKLTDDAPAN